MEVLSCQSVPIFYHAKYRNTKLTYGVSLLHVIYDWHLVYLHVYQLRSVDFLCRCLACCKEKTPIPCKLICSLTKKCIIHHKHQSTFFVSCQGRKCIDFTAISTASVNRSDNALQILVSRVRTQNNENRLSFITTDQSLLC